MKIREKWLMIVTGRLSKFSKTFTSEDHEFGLSLPRPIMEKADMEVRASW